MKKFHLESVVLALGIVLLGLFIQRGLKSFSERDRYVSVKGLAEKEVEADRVIWPIVYKTVGNDLQSLYSDISRANNLIVGFLKKNGIPESDVSIGAPQIVDMLADRYNSNKVSNRYNVTSVITVSSSQVSKARGLMSRMGELLKEGIAISANDYDSRVQYDFTSLNKIKPQMIEEATRNAREAGNKFAKDSESKLGKIKSASQGLFSISDRDANTPFIKNVRVVTTIDYYLDN